MCPCSMYGDWKKAGIILKKLSVNLMPVAQAQLYEDGKLIVKKLQDHIDNQDLNWQPLAENTIRLKKGDETIYVETGYLRDNLSLRKIKSTKDNLVLFIGASPWKKHPESGLKFSDLMIYLEYGTEKITPRPLIRPTFEEVKGVITDKWGDIIYNIVKGG